jgi:hypothetical protein
MGVSDYAVVRMLVKVGWPKVVPHLCIILWCKHCINIDAGSCYAVLLFFQYVYMSDCFERILEENKWVDTGE